MGLQISCDCGSFKAEVASFPENTPGRLVCYCSDCQSFMQKINRTDVLDSHGGTEIVPVYPSETAFLEGRDRLKCNKLTEHGIYRWTTSCCNSPIANTKVGFPWVGLFHSTFTAGNACALEALGAVKSRIYGRDALDGAPHGISEKFSFKDLLVVLPFIIKGKILGKHRNSPFFEADGSTPIRDPELL